MKITDTIDVGGGGLILVHSFSGPQFVGHAFKQIYINMPAPKWDRAWRMRYKVAFGLSRSHVPCSHTHK